MSLFWISCGMIFEHRQMCVIAARVSSMLEEVKLDQQSAQGPGRSIAVVVDAEITGKFKALRPRNARHVRSTCSFTTTMCTQSVALLQVC
jgi:hypothetical protein